MFNNKQGIEIVRRIVAAKKIEEMKIELARREKIAEERSKRILDEIEQRRLNFDAGRRGIDWNRFVTKCNESWWKIK